MFVPRWQRLIDSVHVFGNLYNSTLHVAFEVPTAVLVSTSKGAGCAAVSCPAACPQTSQCSRRQDQLPQQFCLGKQLHLKPDEHDYVFLNPVLRVVGMGVS